MSIYNPGTQCIQNLQQITLPKRTRILLLRPSDVVSAFDKLYCRTVREKRRERERKTEFDKRRTIPAESDLNKVLPAYSFSSSLNPGTVLEDETFNPHTLFYLDTTFYLPQLKRLSSKIIRGKSGRVESFQPEPTPSTG